MKTLTELTAYVTKRIEAGMSPFDLEAHLLSLGVRSAMVGLAFERAATDFREQSLALKREAEDLELFHAMKAEAG
jgi:hypothetical protein